MADTDYIHEQMARAHDLYQAHGPEMAADPNIKQALEEFRREIQGTWDMFGQTEVVAMCTECAGTKSESCCFEGAENWFYEVILLVNLLLGVDLPDKREKSGQCFFIGPKGCKLLARWSICINFFCPEMCEALGKTTLGRLRRQAGREVWTGQLAEDAVRRWLNARGLLDDGLNIR